jgi:transcriptional regulator GlxA family with amidase domain
MVALISNTRHSLRHLLERDSPRSANWLVRRVEEYIETHLDKPLRIEDLVELTGSSARSIYRTFRHSRGYSPMEFTKERRLERARALLLEPESSATVTSVALSCGFADVSHFSKAFSAAFGESPSSVRANKRMKR